MFYLDLIKNWKKKIKNFYSFGIINFKNKLVGSKYRKERDKTKTN